MSYFKKVLNLYIFISLFYFNSYSQNIYNLEKISDMYNELKLNEKISFYAFEFGLKGLSQIEERKNNIITLVDFTKPSTDERMLVIDLDNKKILLSTYVSHGKNTGGLYAKSFSNKNGSHKSSAGFFLTGNIYNGINGASLELYGLEKGLNDNVRKRDIVIHGASYANPSFILKNGRLGRSKGCLAVPTDDNDRLINIINGGSVCYVHINEFEKTNRYNVKKLK